MGSGYSRLLKNISVSTLIILVTVGVTGLIELIVTVVAKDSKYLRPLLYGVVIIVGLLLLYYFSTRSNFTALMSTV